MRNLKKIIAVVVTLVLIFSLASVSVSAATNLKFSLRGATQVGMLDDYLANVGDSKEYYELAVYLDESADGEVGAIQGVITYDTDAFTFEYEKSELGKALEADNAGLNTKENSLLEEEKGTIKFVGLSNKAGVWYVLRFSINDAKTGAIFTLTARGSNAEGTASLTVTPDALSANIVDETGEIINMEGGAILQKTHGLSSEKKHIINGADYEGDKKVMNATVVCPEFSIADMANAGFTPSSGSTVKLVKNKLNVFDVPGVEIAREQDAGNGQVQLVYGAASKKNEGIYTGVNTIFLYVELPENTTADFALTVRFYDTVPHNEIKLANLYNDNIYLLENGTDSWKAYSGNGANTTLPAGFKGLIRVERSALGNDLAWDILDVHVIFRNFAEGNPIYVSLPWFTNEFNTTEYENWYVATLEQTKEPSQELTFDVKVDAEKLALKAATLGSEVVEVGTLFMYTKRLAYRELTLNMTDTKGLAKASYTITANDRNEGFKSLKDFTVNLKNIRWDAMGVSVSARAYIKFKDGTVIYSRNYHNEFETNAGYARESVIGVALDAISTGHYDTVLAAKYGYNVDNINSIATDALSTHKLIGDDRILLLNFIADCYKAPEVVAE